MTGRGEPLEPHEGNPVLDFRTEKLHDIKGHDLAIRFAFGAGVSVVAAVIGKAFSPVVGGMFLAFPAILPATLTLLEKKHGTEDAEHDNRGAVLGALGLVAFALTAASLFGRIGPPLVLVAATVSWVVVATAAYLVIVLRDHLRADRRAAAPS